MIKEPPPFRDQDMPVEHLYAELDHVTAAAREADRIIYLKSMPRGTAMAEAQADGTELASTVLDSVFEPEDIAFVADTLAPAAFNTAWYCGAKGVELVQRRRLKIPKFFTNEGDILAPDEFLDKSRQQFQGAVTLASTVARSTRERSPRLGRHQILYMRHVGNAALALTCSQIDPEIQQLSAYEAQLAARLQCQRMLSAARNLGEVIGRHPSLAQLSDFDSDLSVHWRRKAPDGARSALLEAFRLKQEAQQRAA